MEYEVVLTTQAKTDFRQIINYLLFNLNNEQAAWFMLMVSTMTYRIMRICHGSSCISRDCICYLDVVNCILFVYSNVVLGHFSYCYRMSFLI